MNALVPAGTSEALQLANMMATGKLVPTHLQRSPGDCLMVIEQAMRWSMSPFAVAQCTSVIQGRLMFEGKLVAAALNSSGVLARRLDYEFAGEGATRKVTVRGTLRGEESARELSVELKDAKTTNGMWTKQPDQQLVYFATRAWARRYAPEVMLGVYAPEEFDEQPKAAPFNGTTIEGTPAALQQFASALAEDGARAEAAATEQARPRRTINDWLAAFALAARDVQSAEAANALICGEESLQMKEHLTAKNDPRLERYTAIVSGVLQTWFADPPADEDVVPEMAGSA